MRANLLCSVVIRLDGADPLAPPAESERDHRPEYEAFWVEMARWLKGAGIVPGMWPPAGWCKVEMVAGFKWTDAPRVVAWLKRQGVEVEEPTV